MREPVTCAEQVRANVFPTAEEIAGSFLLVSGNVDGGEGASAVEDGELPGIATVGLDAVPGRPGINDGAMTSHGTSR